MHWVQKLRPLSMHRRAPHPSSLGKTNHCCLGRQNSANEANSNWSALMGRSSRWWSHRRWASICRRCMGKAVLWPLHGPRPCIRRTLCLYQTKQPGKKYSPILLQLSIVLKAISTKKHSAVRRRAGSPCQRATGTSLVSPLGARTMKGTNIFDNCTFISTV